jgi:hypothetical protein
MKCDNCQPECNREVVAYLEYIGKDRELMSTIYVSACENYRIDFDRWNWKLISKEEYIVAKILRD